jgi:hypothetical protein
MDIDDAAETDIFSSYCRIKLGKISLASGLTIPATSIFPPSFVFHFGFKIHLCATGLSGDGELVSHSKHGFVFFHIISHESENENGQLGRTIRRSTFLDFEFAQQANQ